MRYSVDAVGNYDIGNIFMHHQPKGWQSDSYSSIRSKAKEFAKVMEHHCPDSRELDIARIKLEEAVMWANAAIARNT